MRFTNDYKDLVFRLEHNFGQVLPRYEGVRAVGNEIGIARDEDEDIALLGLGVGGLINLLAIMEKFDVRNWLILSEYLFVMANMAPTIENPDDMVIFQNIKSQCHTLGLVYSALLLDWIISELNKTPPPSGADLACMSAELIRRIKDEVSSVLFLRVPTGNARFYEEPLLFGDAVAQNFPSISHEITEAGKCLALGRNTACVFHLMRIVEVGLRTLIYVLRIRVKRSKPTWGDFLAAIEERMKTLPGKKNPWQKHEAFISEAKIHIRDMSKAWRNPLVHNITVFYDEQDARVIFQHVETFMRHLATKLREGTRKLL